MPKSGENFRKLLLLLITWGLLMAFFVFNELYYVKGQARFLQQSGFRSLAALSGEVSLRFAQARISAESSIKLLDRETKVCPPECPDSAAISKEAISDHYRFLHFEEYTHRYLKDIWNLDREEKIAKKSFAAAMDCHPDDFSHRLRFKRRELTLSAVCSDSRSTTAIYELDLRPWIRSGLQQFDGDFDQVLVADYTGQVVFELSAGVPHIANLKSLLISSTGSVTRQNESGSTNPAGDAAEADQRAQAQVSTALKKLTEAAALNTISLGGGSYELFSQPTFPSNRATNEKDDTEQLIVCGLWNTYRFREHSHALPYSALIWGGLIVIVLFSLSWPLFKLRYMANTERFSQKHGSYLMLAIFLLSSSVMLMLLNASYHSQARDTADAGLKNLACQIKDHFKAEMSRAAWQLRQLQSDAIRAAPQDHNHPQLIANYLGGLDRKDWPPQSCYPFFELASYADGDGSQILKFDVKKAPSPPVSVASRPFFKQAISDGHWENPTPYPEKPPGGCDTGGLDHTYLEPLLSRNNDEFLAVLSAPFAANNGNIAVQALSTRPISLVDPVLPPGFQFAVVDTTCKVLFHSQSFRNTRENFCQESKDKAELQPWLFSSADTSLDISYGGTTERAYLTPLSPLPRFTAGQVSLIVFREPGVDLTLNMAVILICSVLMITYFTVLLLAAGIYLGWRGVRSQVYAPRFLWPAQKQAFTYVQLGAANLLMALMFSLLYRRLYEGPLLILTFAVAMLSVLFVVFKLGGFRHSLVWLGGLLAVGGLLGSLSYLFSPALREWSPVFASLAVSGILGLFLSGAVTSRFTRVADVSASISRRINDFAARHFNWAYVFAALGLISAVALVPCAGCFKYAYDSVSELSLKHDQLDLATALVNRRDSIRKYYLDSFEKKGAKDMALRRIAETQDRYATTSDEKDWTASKKDRAFLTLGSGPDNPVESGDSGLACQAPDHQSGADNSSHLDLNHWIETQIARATLLLPSSKLGSEMSKLGVAASEIPCKYPYSWEEPTPTRFRLTSLLSAGSQLTVTAEYPEWQGLRGWAVASLLFLLLLLALWLKSLVTKIFFTNIEDTQAYPAVDWKTVDDVKGNFVVIGRAKSGKSGWLKSIVPKEDWLDLRSELAKKVASGYYRIPGGHGRVLVLDHLEFNIKDCAYNQARLELLETLLYEPAFRLVLVSTIDLLYFLTDSAPGVLTRESDPAVARGLLERWARVLSQFAKVRPKEHLDRTLHEALDAFAKKNPDQRQFATWVRRECNGTTMLRRIGKEILEQFQKDHPVGPSWVWNRVLERADAYYHVLWSVLTPTERLVLYQLAFDGWANPKNGAALQQLERKRLIYKRPMYQIMNESFHRFIQSTEHTDEIAEWEKREKQSTWRGFRYVVIAGVIGVAVWLLYTQAAVTQVVVGSVTAIVTLLTAVSSLFGRSGQPAAASKGT